MSFNSITSGVNKGLKRAYEICPKAIDPESNGYKHMKHAERSSSKSPTKFVAEAAIQHSSSAMSSSSSTSTMISLSQSIVLSSNSVSSISPLFSIKDEVQQFAIESFTKEPLDRAKVQEIVRDLFIKMAVQMSRKDKDAERDIEIAFRLQPSPKAQAHLFMNLAYRYFKNKQWDKAIENCEQGLKLPGMSTYRTTLFHYYLGSSLMYRNQKGDLEKARAEIGTGLVLKHDDLQLSSDLYYSMSKILKMMKPSK